MLFLACGGPPYGRWTRKQQFFSCFFFDFLKDFVCYEQTFIEVPKSVPKQPLPCVKSLGTFEKIQFLNFFDIFPWAPPHGLITDVIIIMWFLNMCDLSPLFQTKNCIRNMKFKDLREYFKTFHFYLSKILIVPEITLVCVE